MKKLSSQQPLPILIVGSALLCSMHTAQCASESTLDEILNGLGSSFALPFEDLLEKPHDSEWDNLLDGLGVSLSTNIPLNREVKTVSEGNGTQGVRRGSSPTSSAGFKYNPLSYWFVSAAFTKYWDDDLQASWNPDFSYVFGYNDWHLYTLSLTYANYGGNRLNPNKSKGETTTNFNQGSWSLGWTFPLSKSLARLFMFDDEGSIGCRMGYSVTPEYFDLASSSLKRNKQSVALGCKYNIVGWWYFSLNMKFYPDPEQQQPWDPDYTYGFGYFDWHPGSISVQYNNYSSNRFPWREQPNNSGHFKDGSISIFWTHKF